MIQIKYLFNIRAKTIRMQQPMTFPGNMNARTPFIKSRLNEILISAESGLRRFAYKNTAIKTDGSFFDDTDMKSDYYLVVVYDKRTTIPLLTARYYFEKSLIDKSIKGEENNDNGENNLTKNINWKNGKVFLADRLSGNISSSVYRKYRNYIFSLFYSEIINYNKNCHLILMARSEPHEKLLTKYLRLGFNIIGSTIHKGKKHWIVIADLKKAYSSLRASNKLHAFLFFRRLFKYQFR
jgi:hypothetical protein